MEGRQLRKSWQFEMWLFRSAKRLVCGGSTMMNLEVGVGESTLLLSKYDESSVGLFFILVSGV
jgi:hypothetical protein